MISCLLCSHVIHFIGWLSLARDCVLYVMQPWALRGIISLWKSLQWQWGQANILRTRIITLLFYSWKWYLRALKMTPLAAYRRLKTKTSLKPTEGPGPWGPSEAQMTEGCPLRSRKVACDGWNWLPLGPRFSLLCNTHPNLNQEWARQWKGLELTSDLLGSGLTIIAETRLNDPVSTLCCVNFPLFSCFYKGLLSGLDPVPT